MLLDAESLRLDDNADIEDDDPFTAKLSFEVRALPVSYSCLFPATNRNESKNLTYSPCHFSGVNVTERHEAGMGREGQCWRGKGIYQLTALLNKQTPQNQQRS